MSKTPHPRRRSYRTMDVLVRLDWVFHSGTAISKRRHFKSHKRMAFRLDVRDNLAARSLKKKKWTRVDLEEARSFR